MTHRLFYVSPRDMRKNRADCVHMMKSCHEFARQGYQVTLLTPRVYRSDYPVSRQDIFRLYGMPETFRIVELPTRLTDDSSTRMSRIQKAAAFGLYFLYQLLAGNLGRTTTIYAKCFAATLPIVVLRRLRLLPARLFFETAEFSPTKKIQRLISTHVDGVVCGNQYVRDSIQTAFGLDPRHLLRMPFPTQYPEIAAHIATQPMPSRASLGLPANGRLVTYAGKVHPTMREIRYILEAARLIPEENFVLVGVSDGVRDWFNNYLAEHQLRNVTLIGFQPLARFYDYVRSSDLLLSYYDSFDPLSSHQRSPAKACVYLSFEKPVIMADLPSLREWWNDEQIFFVAPDQPAALAAQIRTILAQPELAAAKAARCVEFARNNTYATSYLAITRFMRSLGAASPAHADPAAIAHTASA